MSGTVKFPIEIVDRWGKPLKRFRRDVDSLDRVKAKDPLRDMPKSLDHLRRDLERYKRKQAEAFRTSHVKRYGRMIEATERKINKLERSTASCGKKTTGFFSKIKNNFGINPATLITGVLAGGMARLGNEAIKASAKFEKYTVTLKTMLGSQGAARERMDEYADIAAKTPFQLRQVVEAGNQLQAIGRYSRDNLTQLGDLAAASGKPIEQVMNAYAKLSTGQKGEAVNMFRDLLISSEDWANATGKGIKKNGELAATTEEMLGALPKILKKKGFFGMMDQQAKTTEGRLSNLGDSFDMLKVAVGDNMKPAFDSFISGTTKIVENMRRWVEVPTAEKIGKEKAQLNSLVGIITDANTGEQTRSDLLRELQQQYPEFLKGIDLETVKNEELRKKLVEVNAQYENKMRLASMKDFLSEEERKLQELYDKQSRISTGLQAKGEVRNYEFLLKDKFGIEEVKSGQTVVRSFNDAAELAMERYKKRLTTNPEDTEAKEYLDTYSNYKAWSAVDSERGSMFDSKSELQEVQAEIKQLETVLAIYQGNVKAEERKQLLEKARGIDIGDTATFEKLFGKKDQKEAKNLASEFDQMRQKPLEAIEKWSRLSDFVEGKLKYRTGASPEGSPSNGANPPGTDSLEKASATITGGGRMVKQVHVTIENLIGENTNIFKEGQTITDAHEFMDKMTHALQVAVNDVN